VVVGVKECVCDALSKVGLTEVLACWTVMVKTIVVKKIQRSCKGLLLLKVRMKVELAVRCDGQGEKVLREMEHEGLVYLCNYVANVVLLKIPAYYPADWHSHRGYLLSSVFWFLFLVFGNLPLPWLVHTWHAALSPHVLAHSDLQGNATCIAEHSCLP